MQGPKPLPSGKRGHADIGIQSRSSGHSCQNKDPRPRQAWQDASITAPTCHRRPVCTHSTPNSAASRPFPLTVCSGAEREREVHAGRVPGARLHRSKFRLINALPRHRLQLPCPPPPRACAAGRKAHATFFAAFFFARHFFGAYSLLP